MKKVFLVVCGLVFCIAGANAQTYKFESRAQYQVCFTHGGNCTQLIVDTIAKEKKQILVQAYLK